MSLSEYRPIDLVSYSILFALSIFIAFPRFTYNITGVCLIPLLVDYSILYYKNIKHQTVDMHMFHIMMIITITSLIIHCLLNAISKKTA
uniref:Uncharacterized protein n=1 Tax=viral metagenome TaxID=1070528 RepID=A0A6C0JUM1_9ZZZZ